MNLPSTILSLLAGYSTPTYVMLCMSDVGDLNSVKGLKIRTAGTAQNEWAASLGAVPVAAPMTDVYTGLERGSIDCTLSDPTSLEKVSSSGRWSSQSPRSSRAPRSE